VQANDLKAQQQLAKGGASLKSADAELIDSVLEKLEFTLEDIQQSKMIISAEDKIREEIRRRLKALMAEKEET